ncbi:MAG: hypothetical protein LBI40_03950 [Treponema sp.]|jgi:hypothetical protein|nr:hypothetical protein [Treponema sp.]
MMNKRVIGIALILMAIVVGSAFAADIKEGYYRASNGYILVLMNNYGTWDIKYLNDNGKTRGTFEGNIVGSTLGKELTF